MKMMQKKSFPREAREAMFADFFGGIAQQVQMVSVSSALRTHSLSFGSTLSEAFNGWGTHGLCNDSAAVPQQAVQGQVNSCLLVMNDPLLQTELSKPLANRQEFSALDRAA